MILSSFFALFPRNVILSAAKNLIGVTGCSRGRKILRCAQNDRREHAKRKKVTLPAGSVTIDFK